MKRDRVHRVSHFKKEVDLSGVEAPDQTRANTVKQHANKAIAERRQPTCQNCKRPSHTKKQTHQVKKKENNKLKSSNTIFDKQQWRQ